MLLGRRHARGAAAGGAVEPGHDRDSPTCMAAGAERACTILSSPTHAFVSTRDLDTGIRKPRPCVRGRLSGLASWHDIVVHGTPRVTPGQHRAPPSRPRALTPSRQSGCSCSSAPRWQPPRETAASSKAAAWGRRPPRQCGDSVTAGSSTRLDYTSTVCECPTPAFELSRICAESTARVILLC